MPLSLTLASLGARGLQDRLQHRLDSEAGVIPLFYAMLETQSSMSAEMRSDQTWASAGYKLAQANATERVRFQMQHRCTSMLLQTRH